jgi:hypothetical protein
MVEETVRTLWIPTGLILGFQVTFFKWRLEREVQLTDKAADADKALPTYLVSSDYLSIAGMLCFVGGVILLPTSGISATIAPAAFGLGVLLFVGQVLGLAGHYDLYNHRPRRVSWFPRQEKIAVGFTIVVSVAYILWQILR